MKRSHGLGIQAKTSAARAAAAMSVAAAVLFTGCSGTDVSETEMTTTSATTEATTTTTQAPQLADLIVGHRFRGNTYNRDTNEYRDISMIDFVVDLQSVASESSWTYGYKIELDGEVLSSETGLTVEGDDELPVQLMLEDGIFDEGHLYIEVYDDRGRIIDTGECEIIHSAPVGTSAIPQIEINEDGTFVIPGTELRFYPNNEDYYSIDPFDADYRTRAQQLGAVTAIYYAMYQDDGIYSLCGYAINYIGEYNYYEFDYEEDAQIRLLRQMTNYDARGIPYTAQTIHLDLYGTPCTAYMVITHPEGSGVETAGEIPVTAFLMYFGDEDVTYMLSGLSPEEDFGIHLLERITCVGDENLTSDVVEDDIITGTEDDLVFDD